MVTVLLFVYFCILEKITVSNYNLAMMFIFPQSTKTCYHGSISDWVSSLTFVCVLLHPHLRTTCWVWDPLLTYNHNIDVIQNNLQQQHLQWKKLSGHLTSLHCRHSVTRRFGRDSLLFCPSCINNACEKSYSTSGDVFFPFFLSATHIVLTSLVERIEMLNY